MVASDVAAKLHCHALSYTTTAYYYILSTGSLPRFRTLSFGHNLFKMPCLCFVRERSCACVCVQQRTRMNEQTIHFQSTMSRMYIMCAVNFKNYISSALM